MNDKRETEVMKILSARLREARELTNFNIKEAAEIMGVPVEDLRKIEAGVDLDVIPLHVIKLVAQTMDVSVDFLFSLNADWEVAPEVRRERDFLSHLQKKLAADKARIAAKLVQQQAQINALSTAVESLAPAIQAISNAINAFELANSGFPDMPKGSPVLLAVSNAQIAAEQAIIAMVRQKLLPAEMLRAYTSTKAA